MRLGEETAGLGGILVQAGLGTITAKLIALGWGCGVLVGSFEGAVTVPAVAWTMLIPEGMVDGEDGVPEDLMVGTGMDGGGWHPSEIGEDVGLGLELLPLDGLLGTEHSCAVFGLEPRAYLVGGDGGDELAPLAEASEVALVIDEETGHVLLDAVDLVGGEDVGTALEGGGKIGLGRGGWLRAIHGSLRGRAFIDGGLEDVADCLVHAGLDPAACGVFVLVDSVKVVLDDLLVDVDGAVDGVACSQTWLRRGHWQRQNRCLRGRGLRRGEGVAVVEVVDYQSKSCAPRGGAGTKKGVARFLGAVKLGCDWDGEEGLSPSMAGAPTTGREAGFSTPNVS